MSSLKSKKIIAVHDGVFHADDVFSVATLSLYLKTPIKIIRTRDTAKLSTADYLIDVGMKYGSAKNIFDHHQPGGAGARDNGIPYSSFGLIWKEYGEKLTGSKECAEIIDQKFVSSIDAVDNVMDIYRPTIKNFRPYLLSDYILDLNQTWKEEDPKKQDRLFSQAVDFAKEFLLHEIKRTKDVVESNKKIIEAYNNAKDKRIIVLDGNYSWGEIIKSYKEPLFVIRPVPQSQWHISCVPKDGELFKTKIEFPKSWAGLDDGELAKVTGVMGAIFCHSKLFFARASTLVGALSLAKLAIENQEK